MNVFATWLLLLCQFIFSGTNANPIQISTTLGDIVGIEESGYGVFKGIPYTEETMDGNNRFKPSTVRTSSFANGNGTPLNATDYGFNCVQIPEAAPQSEDCLFLNIWTPKLNNSYPHSLPVLLFIHGGSFKTGSGSSSLITGSTFLRNKNIVYVTINYRLAGLGFLALSDLWIETNMTTTGGSNGILDAIIAIKFVKQYISDFGGNPSQITIFGVSAGARSVNMILLSPLAKDLINNAMIESGSLAQIGLGSKSMNDALKFTENVLNSENIENNITLLRSLDADIVYALSWHTPLENGLIVKGEIGIPSADGYVLNDTGLNVLNTPNISINANNIIIGFNDMDSLMGLPYYYWRDSDNIPLVPSTENEFNIYMNEYIENQTLLNNILQYYDINDYPSFDKLTNYGYFYTKMNAESCYICTSINLAKKIIENGNGDTNVYVYHLIGPQYPSVHINELSYVYNNSAINTIFYGGKMSWDQGLANLMHNDWLDMTINNKVHSDWLPFDLTNEYIMDFIDGETSSISKGYGNHRCDYWINNIGLNIMGSICVQDKTVIIPTPTQQPTLSPTTSPIQTGSTNTAKTFISILFIFLSVIF